MNHPESAADRPATGRRRAATLRAFFALWPDPAARDALALLTRDVAALAQGHAAPAANLHLTLAFVGDVAPARVTGLCAIGAAVAANASQFTLTLDRTGTFRGTGITWLGTGETPPHLERLGRSLAEGLAAGGFAVEPRAFSPHVTLARRCRTRADVALAAPIAWVANRLVLNVSDLRSGTPTYRELASWPLGARATGNSVP
jgi:2'-5' RNA ligase